LLTAVRISSDLGLAVSLLTGLMRLICVIPFGSCGLLVCFG
jgi:hypothetical protein